MEINISKYIIDSSLVDLHLPQQSKNKHNKLQRLQPLYHVVPGTTNGQISKLSFCGGQFGFNYKCIKSFELLNPIAFSTVCILITL